MPPTGAPPSGGSPAGRRGRDNGSSLNEVTDPGVLGFEAEAVTIMLAPTGEAERVGRYVVRGVLGRGGMGVVYEVESPGVPGRLALKTIETRFLELSDGAAAQRFRHEIKVLERLIHPSVVRLFDAGIARHPLGYELAYYVMEKLDGDTLVPGIKSGVPFPPDEALRVVAGLADALDYLQRNNVLHRDIKPGNVFLEKSGRVVLVDFGLARSQEFTRLTLAGQIVGTFSYMSPERLAGQVVDVAADVFAVGVVFFQMLTGRHPFGSGTPPELMAAIHRGIDWPEIFNRIERAAELKPLISAMLAIDARARPTPAALAERVRAMRARRGPGPSLPPSAARPPLAAGTVTESFPAAPEGRPVDAAPARPPLTVLIETGNAAKPARDPAAVPAPGGWGSISATDPTPARGAERAPLPTVAVRTASGGPSWMMFGFASGSLACLAFTVGLLVGHQARRGEAPRTTAPPDTAPADSAAPSPTPPSPSSAAYGELLAQARESLDRGDAAASIRYALAALQVQPEAADPHRALGDAYGRSGDLASALKHYRTYAQKRPDADDRASIDGIIQQYEERLAAPGR